MVVLDDPVPGLANLGQGPAVRLATVVEVEDGGEASRSAVKNRGRSGPGHAERYTRPGSTTPKFLRKSRR